MVWAINNFNSMDLSEIYQPSPLRKISNSTLQFRQLIESLRNTHKSNKQIIQAPISCNMPKENQSKNESTMITAEERTTSQNNNFLLDKQSDTNLQPKQRVSVGGRDKLKRKSIALDVNPELSPAYSRQISPVKQQTSIHLHQQPSKDLFNTYISPRVNVSTQYEFESNLQTNFISVKSAREQIKTGQIVRQHIRKEEEKKIDEVTHNKKIRDIDENLVIEYLGKEKKISNKSEPSEIFSFFTNLCLSCDIIIKNPSIKKFKNCVYYGFPIQQALLYEGLLYFYDEKIYYGEFMNGYKHGLGIELDLRLNTKMKGEFKQGRKTGKFYIEKPHEKYIGYLENGQYQGEGRLTTQDYIYEGLFERGEKNGYGEEYYPKTGLRMTGIFRNGVLELSKNSKSIPQIRNKSKSTISKQKAKLELIRKRSLQKHNQRMNKIREKRQQETQYQIEFNTTEEYDAPKIQFNPSKLEMYRQIPQKLPKICQQFEYSFQTASHLQSNHSHRIAKQYRFQVPKIKKDMMFEMNERVGTSQLEEPLPTPCLTVLRSKK